MIARLAGVLLLLLAMAPALADPPSGFEPVSRQSVTVSRGQRLEVTNITGTIAIEGWDGDTVEVQADHQARDRLSIQATGAIWHVGPHIEGAGPGDVSFDPPDRARIRIKDAKAMPGVIDLWLRVPSWLPVVVHGLQVDVTVDGTAAPLEVGIMSGDVRVRRHSATIQVRAFQGRVELEQITGAIDIEGSEQPTILRDCSGTVRVETTTGNLELVGLDTTHLEAATVSGDIVFRGALSAHGRYELSTHSGTIELQLPRDVGVEASLRTHRGQLLVELPGVEPPDRKRKRWSATLGDGAARLRADAFTGTIRITAQEGSSR